MMTTKTKTRKDELFDKLTTSSLTSFEKLELAELLTGEAQKDSEEEFKIALQDVIDYINSKSYPLKKIADELIKHSSPVILFKMPYSTNKGFAKTFEYYKDKPTIGVTGGLITKLRKAKEDQRTEWATPEGLEFMETDEYKRWLAGAK